MQAAELSKRRYTSTNTARRHSPQSDAARTSHLSTMKYTIFVNDFSFVSLGLSGFEVLAAFRSALKSRLNRKSRYYTSGTECENSSTGSAYTAAVSESHQLLTANVKLAHMIFIRCQARSQNCEKRLQASSCLSVRPSVRMEQLESHWADFNKI